MLASSVLFKLLVGTSGFSIALGGDIMLNGIPAGSHSLSALSPLFHSADFRFANLEIPLSNCGVASLRKSPDERKRKAQFVLHADPSHISDLADAGITGVSLGNNHAMDYGEEGLRQEINLLDHARIGHAGAGRNAKLATSLCVIQQGGHRVGLLSALAFATAPALRKTTPATLTDAGVSVVSFGGNIDDKAQHKLDRWIGAARQQCDFLIVAFHWGVERKPLPNAYQRALARAAIRAGADLVWGHHPHVLQPVEWYRGVPILFSMGNLVSPLPGSSAIARLDIANRRVTHLVMHDIAIRGGRAKTTGASHRVLPSSDPEPSQP